MKIKEFIQRLLIGPIYVLSLIGLIYILKRAANYLNDHSYILEYFAYTMIAILILSLGFISKPNKDDDDDQMKLF